MQRWGNIPGIYWIFVTRPNVGLDEQDEKQQGVTPEGSKRKHETYTSSPKFNIPFVICPIFPRFLLEITPEACFEHRFFIILSCRYASLTLGDVTFQPCLSRPTVRSGVNLKRHSQEDKKTGNSFVHLKCREETLDAEWISGFSASLVSSEEKQTFVLGHHEVCVDGGMLLFYMSDHWKHLAQRELPSFPASLSKWGGGPLSCFQLKMESCPFKQLLTEGERGVAGKEDTLRRRGGCLCVQVLIHGMLKLRGEAEEAPDKLRTDVSLLIFKWTHVLLALTDRDCKTAPDCTLFQI